MFDVGFWELILVFGLGLVILGPERLPRVAAKIGRWVGQARRTANQLRRQLEMEIKLDDPPSNPPSYSRPKPPPAPTQTDTVDTADTTDAEPADTGAPATDVGMADTESDIPPETIRKVT